MGCTSDNNIQVEENTNSNKQNNPDSNVSASKKIKSNDKNLNNNLKINECIEENPEEEDISHFTHINNNNETNSKSKEQNSNNIFFNYDRNNNINYKINQSTNFKYMKNNLVNANQKNNYSTVFNQTQEKTKDKFIMIKHPLDNSLDDKEIEIHQIKSYTNEKQFQKNDDDNNKIEVNNSIEERINNFNYEEEEDGVNMGGMGGDDDDMCNLGLSTEVKTDKKNNKNEIDNKDINILFEIQATSQKINIKAARDIKLIDLIELFRKKMKLSPFEKPEFVFNTVFLIDSDKPISDYNINDGDKINVFI